MSAVPRPSPPRRRATARLAGAKGRPSVRPARRVALLLGMLVVLPVSLLIGLGFGAMTIEQDLARAEREERVRAENALDDAHAVIERYLGALEQRLAPVLASTDWARVPEEGLRGLIQAAPDEVVGVVVLVDGAVRYPEPLPEPTLILVDALEPGARLELEGRAREAAELYSEVIDLIPGQRGQAIAHHRAGRAWMAAGEPERALVLYRQLEQMAGRERDDNGVPLAAIAHFQRCRALARLERPEALDVCQTCLSRILEGAWQQGSAAEGAMARRLLQLLYGEAGLAPEADEQEAPQRARLEALLALWQAQVEGRSLLPQLALLPPPEAPFHIQPENADDAVFLRQTGEWHGQPATIAVQLGRASMVQNLREELGVGPLEIRLERLGQGGRAGLLGFRPLEGALRGWSLSVYPGAGQAPAQWVLARRRITRALLSTVGLVTLVGLLLTWRAVRNEMDLARRKSDFVSTVSHELKTPITTIRAMAEMLSLGILPAERQKHYGNNIIGQADRLGRLIDNLLDMSAIEAGQKKIQLTKQDPEPTLRQIAASVEGYLERERFEFVVDLPDRLPSFPFDADGLTQAVINLLSNAARYSEERRWIRLRARAEGAGIRIEVTDRGCGIPASELPRLTERFYRVGHHMTRKARGTGLGLAIVHFIVEAHGGALEVESVVGEGSTFAIVLPGGSGEQDG